MVVGLGGQWFLLDIASIMPEWKVFVLHEFFRAERGAGTFSSPPALQDHISGKKNTAQTIVGQSLVDETKKVT